MGLESLGFKLISICQNADPALFLFSALMTFPAFGLNTYFGRI